MSDEKDKKKDKKDKDTAPSVPKADTLAGALPEPTPKRPDFFEWLESLFDGSTQFPEKIEWRVIEGKKRDRLGPLIRDIVYKPNAPKPSREEIVALSNKILNDVQYDCDVQRRPVIYQVAALHFVRDSDYYARFLISCSPRALGSGHGAPRDGEEGDGEESEAQRVVNQVLRHQETMVGLFGAAFEGILDRQDRMNERAYDRIERLEARQEKLVDMLERAQSLEVEREEKRMWNRLKIEGVQKTLDMAMVMVPPVIARLTGQKQEPGTETPETLTLKNFMDRLTDEQRDQVFGVYGGEPDYKLLKPGVLSWPQAELFVQIAQCLTPVDRIDELMPGGPLAISMDQIKKLAAIVPMEQLAPLHLIFEARQRKQQAAQGDAR